MIKRKDFGLRSASLRRPKRTKKKISAYVMLSEPNYKIKSEMKSEKMRENAKNKEKIKETEIYFNFNAKSA